MIPEHVTWSFENSRIGQRVLVFESLASTNTTAAELSALPDSDGLVVLAKFQTSGRGQYGRVWQSQPGTSLLMSVIVNPPQQLRRPAILTAVAGIAVAQAVEALSPARALLKWPNDILISGRKVCGILIELHRTTAVMGIGLNLNQSAEGFADAGLMEATSLQIASGSPIDLRAALEKVLRQLDRIYCSLLEGGRASVEAEWMRRLGLLGRGVSVELMDGSMLSGRLHALEFDRLLLETPEGAIQVLLPESIRHVVAV